MILYADRFSLFNRNNATAVPVMIAEGNELYIDTARIKNSSLTSTKIADGSITNAKSRTRSARMTLLTGHAAGVSLRMALRSSTT